jgi:hypothetical protein
MGAGFAADAGLRACMLLPDGSASCWGMGHGDSTMVFGPLSGPAPIPGIARAHALGDTDGIACAAVRDRVSCWGAHVGLFLGLNTPDESTPAVVPGLDATAGLSVASRYVCGQAEDGDVRCAGWGQLVDAGGAMLPLVFAGARLEALAHTHALSMGASGGCAIGEDGRVRCVIWRSPDWDQPPPPPARAE